MTPEDKERMTLDDAKDKVAESKDYQNWDDMQESESDEELLLEALEEAAELYAKNIAEEKDILIAEKEESISALREIVRLNQEAGRRLGNDVSSLQEALRKCENEKNEIANNANMYIKKLEQRLHG